MLRLLRFAEPDPGVLDNCLLLSPAARTGSDGDASSGVMLTELLHSAVPSALDAAGLVLIGLLLSSLHVGVL